MQISGDSFPSVRGRRFVWGALLALALCILPFAAAAGPLTFTVNSTADVPDATPGDGVCETATGNKICTLRAAVQEANAHAGADTINLPAGAPYLLSRVGVDNTALNGDLDITDSVTIVGAGPAATVIDGNGGTTSDRVLEIVRCIGNAMPQMDYTCLNDAYVVVSISGVTLQNGHATQASVQAGGGVSNAGLLTLQNCVVTGNLSSYLNDWGGGIYNSGSLTLSNSVVSNNATGGHNAYGGGIFNQGSLTMVNSTISGNTTYGGGSSPGHGGGIFGGNVIASGSTISGNSAALGGGLYATTTVVLTNSTISGNYSDGSGGGLYVASGTTGLYNVTITQNQANADASGSAVGGGVTNAAGTLTFINTIISANELVIATVPFPTLDNDECSGTLTSQGYNLMTYVEAFHCTIAGPYTSTDVTLGPLQFNGGFTKTHALPVGSAAIDAGNPSGCTDKLGAPITTDQRGVPRPYGAHCDVGAFEAAEIIFQNGFQL